VVHLAGALLDPLIRDVHLETRVQACNVQVNAKYRPCARNRSMKGA
jgi:hypothetical protein